MSKRNGFYLSLKLPKSFRTQTAAQKEAESLKRLKLEREAQLAKEAEEKRKYEEGEKERETLVFTCVCTEIWAVFTCSKHKMETAAKIEAKTLRRGVLKLNEQMIKEDQMAHEALYVICLFDLL